MKTKNLLRLAFSFASVAFVISAFGQVKSVYDIKFVNLSARAQVGQYSLIAGVTLKGGGEHPLLIRAIGPTLSQFGITHPCSQPSIVLFKGNDVVATKTGWDGSQATRDLFAKVGAFDLPSGSKDTVLLISLPPGSYTAVISTPDASPGIAEAEIYDANIDLPGSEMVNMSARAYCGTGEAAPILGMVYAGKGVKNIMVRAVGPSLAQFGMADLLPDPKLTVVDFRTGKAFKENDDWDVGYMRYFTKDGAFPLVSSKEAVVGWRVDNSSSTIPVDRFFQTYTMVVADATGKPGQVIFEAYDDDP